MVRWVGAVIGTEVFPASAAGNYERRIKEGKTRREIVRCLKRYAARGSSSRSGPHSHAPRQRGSCER